VRTRSPLFALVAASGVATAGSTMTVLAIPWFVLATTGSGATTGLVAGVETLGLLVSMTLAGPLVDRYGARRSSVIADLWTAVTVVTVPLLHLTAGISLPALLALSFAIGLGRAPSRSAKQVLLPETADLAATTVERGASAREAAERTGDLLGAPLGGLLITVLGPPQVLLADALALLIAAALVAAAVACGDPVVTQGVAGGLRGYLRGLREAASELRADRLLVAVAVVVAVSNALFAGLFSVLVPAFGRQVWHSSTLTGVVVAAVGAGGLLGALLYGWQGHRFTRWVSFTAGFFLCGGPLFVVIALDPPPGVLVGLVMLCAAGNGPLNPLLAAVKNDRVPVRVRGSVFGALAASAIAAMPLGTMVAGLLLDATGPATAAWILAAVCFAVTLCPLLWPVWRELDAPPLLGVREGGG
jgi:MFS family permease